MAKKKGSKQLSTAKKKLRRSSNRVLLGVLGGLAEYFEADPLHVRMLFIVILLAAGLGVGAVAYALVPTVLTIGLVAYVIAYLLMTESPAN